MAKFEVTLKELRDNSACVEGYNKVVCMLKRTKYEYSDNYMRFKHDEPISLIDIANNNGIYDALWCLSCNHEWTRDSRLFAVWCARQVQHLITDERSINALDVAEKHAYGLATDEELAAAWAAGGTAWAAAWDAAGDDAWAAAQAAAGDAAWAAGDAAWAAAQAAARAAAGDAAGAAQKEMFIKMCKGEAPWQK